MDTSTHTPSPTDDTTTNMHTPPSDNTHTPTTNTPQVDLLSTLPSRTTLPFLSPHDPSRPSPEAVALQNFIREDTRIKEGQAQRIRALEDQLIGQTLMVERLINWSTQLAESNRQRKEEEDKQAADLRAAAAASIAALELQRQADQHEQKQAQARLAAELDAKLQASVNMIAAPIANIMDQIKQLTPSLPSIIPPTPHTSTEPTQKPPITPSCDPPPTCMPQLTSTPPPTPYTPASQLPHAWVSTQVTLRHQAWAIMDPNQPITNAPSTHRLSLNQLRRHFRQGAGRQMTIDDLPHWRVLDFPPNPADTNLDTYFQYLYSYLPAHMPPREHHRTFAADPRDPQELDFVCFEKSRRATQSNPFCIGNGLTRDHNPSA
jgi:hypothetical protein